MQAKVPPRWPNGDEEIRTLRETLVEVQRDGGSPRRSNTRRTYVVLGVLALAVGMCVDRQGTASGKTSVPYGRSTVISEQSAGIGAHPDDFEARASAPPAPTARPTPEPTARPRRSRPAAPRRDPVEIAQAFEPTETLVSERELADALAAATPEPTPTPLKLMLNVGTRFPIRLLTAATTSAGGGVCSAETTDAVALDGTVVLPFGTRLEGLAYATNESDRAQIVLRAMIVDGKTIPLQGIVIGADGDLGLRGKVLRKASKLKHLAGRVGGALADAAMWGGVGGDYGVIDQLANGAGRDVNAIEQQWTRSDKVVRVPAGTAAVVYLRSDVVVQR